MFNVSKDEELNLGTLQIFLDSSMLTIFNYSLIDSSLNIKLELNNKESKTQQEIIRDKRIPNTQQETFKPLSTVFLHPILEDNIIKCPHNGIVQLKSKKGKSLKSKNIPMILESDLLNSSIIGCTNSIAGFPNPCTQVALILPTSRALKKHNEDYPMMQDLCSSGVFSDKGFPLTCTPKPNTFRINSPNPSLVNPISKEELLAQIDPTPPSLTLLTPFKDLEEYYFTPCPYENRESKDSLIQSQTNFYTPNQIQDFIFQDLKQEEDYAILETIKPLESVLKELLEDYDKKYFSFRIFTLRIAYTLYEYLLVIPKNIPAFIHKLLKKQRNKEELAYGYGHFIDLQRNYIRAIDNTKEQHYSNALTLNIQGSILICPSGMQRVKIEVR